MQLLIEPLFDNKPAIYTAGDRELFAAFLISLTEGRIRAAEPDPAAPSGWRVNAWVKKGILVGIRIVPGGSSVRQGAYLGRNVTCMPPMYINVGAWVGDGTMVDSHALVGSC